MQRNSSMATKTETTVDIVAYVFRAVGALGIDTRNGNRKKMGRMERPRCPHTPSILLGCLENTHQETFGCQTCRTTLSVKGNIILLGAEITPDLSPHPKSITACYESLLGPRAGGTHVCTTLAGYTFTHWQPRLSAFRCPLDTLGTRVNTE